MTEAQKALYWLGIIIMLSGGIALSAALIAGMVGLSLNFFWRKMGDAYTFKELRKAWVFYQEHKDELEKNNG